MPFTRRHLAGTLLVTLIGLLLANGLLAYALRNTVPHLLHRQLLTRGEIHTLALGNSTIAAGFNPASFSESWPEAAPAMNAGLGAADIPQWYVAWRQATDGHKDVRIVIIGGFDHLLTHAPLKSWKTWHSNNSFAFFAPAAFSEPYATNGLADRLLYRSCRTIPMFTERGGPWSKVEKSRRWLESLGMPKANFVSNTFGRVQDSGQLLEQNEEVFRSTCSQAVTTQTPFVPAVRDMLAEARQKNIRTVLVLMPLPPARHTFYDTPEWKAYVTHLSQLSQAQGGLLIAATQWLQDASMFDDQIHLSARGAAEFSKQLAQHIASKNRPD